MDHERLTSGQRESLRRALEDKRTSLRHDIELREEEAAEGQVDSAEVEDIAEGVVEDRDREALLEHDRAVLAEVEHALVKLNAGTYGFSETSGRPIPFARLLALPWARNDADEAERIEHAARH
ncbi:MAG TPA: TraR/DksA family transcriptional regulator [Polyangiaceae bacterium]